MVTILELLIDSDPNEKNSAYVTGQFMPLRNEWATVMTKPDCAVVNPNPHLTSILFMMQVKLRPLDSIQQVD